MDQNAFDLDSDLDLDSELDRDIERTIDRLAAPTTHRRATATLTNSPGCAPARTAESSERASLVPRPTMRRVAVASWSSPASASWARPSRTLRKVARRAVEADMLEPA